MTSSSKNYQQMQTQLDELVEKLVSQEGDLDQSLLDYQQAMKLIKEMEIYLKSTENNIKKINKNFSD